MKLLVTTALEETWGTTEDIIFLGEWCKLYDRKDKWIARNYEVLPYNWDDRKKLYEDYDYLGSLYEKILKELSAKLNKLHHVNYGENYWRISVGIWLGFFIQISYQRWVSISNASKSAESLESIIMDQKGQTVVPLDMTEFIVFFSGDTWNHYIFSSIIRFQNKIKYQILGRQKRSNTQPFVVAQNKSIKKTVTKLLFYLIKKVNNAFLYGFSKNNKYFFITTYLSVFDEMRFNIRFGQVPFLVRPDKIPETTLDNKKRHWSLEYDGNDEFERFIKFMIPQQVPKVYIEGYQKLNSHFQTINWPKSPKIIFTSNSHIYDDFTKLWIAAKVDAGASLVIGQHGGGPLHKLNFQTEHELIICHRYLAPGINEIEWNKKILSVGQLFKREWSFNDNGRGLIVEQNVSRYSYALMSTIQSDDFLHYLKDQKRFARNLPEKIRKEFTIRLGSTDYGFSERLRWIDNFPEMGLDNGYQPIYQLLKQSRIIVCTYAGTTYTQTLAANAPTVIFWDEKYNQMHDQSIPYFEALKKAKIFHKTPESAAEHVTKVWDNINDWWMSGEVQSARNYFCKQYAHVPVDLLGNIERGLREEYESCRNN